MTRYVADCFRNDVVYSNQIYIGTNMRSTTHPSIRAAYSRNVRPRHSKPYRLPPAMASEANQNQDATAGEEIASTTIPSLQGDPPPKRNACIPSTYFLVLYRLLNLTTSHRPHVPEATASAEKATSLRHTPIRPSSNHHFPRPRRSRSLHRQPCLFPCITSNLP